MTRILVQRGPAGSSSSPNQNRSSTSSASISALCPSSSSASPQHQVTGTAQVDPTVKDENLAEVQNLDELSDKCTVSDNKSEDITVGSLNTDPHEGDKSVKDETMHNDADIVSSGNSVEGSGGFSVVDGETDAIVGSSIEKVPSSSYPPPPPVPPPKPSKVTLIARISQTTGSSRRSSVLPGVSSMSSPTGSRPPSPRSHSEGEGYNSADEQSPCFRSCYDDTEREHQFEIDLRRAKGLEVRKMLEDGNCLFRAVADQVYGDSEQYDLVRQMCIDYMEQERDHFSQFITEGFTSYCKRKRRDKVYGNNVEIQALSEIYNRPIHIYSYSTEPINIFHGNYNTETPPIRLSYRHGNHYDSLVDPRRLTVGAGLGFSSLRGTNVDKDKVKAAIKAQQDQQIDNALLAEGRFYSDLELTEKEIERMVMEASRAEYLADDKLKQHLGARESSTSRAEPSSSAARSSSNVRQEGGGHELGSSSPGIALSGSVQELLSMGFSYLQVIEAYSIFGDDVDSMICYLIETNSSGRNKGKATEK